MNSLSYKQPASIAILVLAAMLAITGCSQKPSTEETAAQNKAMIDKAVEDTKKQMLADQAAEKAKQDAANAAQAEEKNRQDAAVATAKKELLAEQHAADAKTRARKSSSNPVLTNNPPPTNKVVCINCGVVLSVNETQTEGKGSGLGWTKIFSLGFLRPRRAVRQGALFLQFQQLHSVCFFLQLVPRWRHLVSPFLRLGQQAFAFLCLRLPYQSLLCSVLRLLQLRAFGSIL